MSSIRPEGLPALLARSLQACYVVCGDEHLLATESLDALRAAARAAGHEDREVFSVEAGFDWDRLQEAASSLSLFSDRRILEIHIPSGKPGTTGVKRLVALAENPPADCVTLIVLPKVDRRAAWYTRLSRAVPVVDASPVSREALPGWVSRRLELAGFRVDGEAGAYLAAQVEGNLLAADQEIRKLALLYPPGPLSLDELRAAVGRVSRHDVFDLVDAALAGELARALVILDELAASGSETPLVLWALAQRLRLLLQLHRARAGGEEPGRAMRRLKVWSNQQAGLLRALERTRMPMVRQLLGSLAAVDRAFKGCGARDHRQLLRELVLSLARGRPWPEVPLR